MTQNKIKKIADEIIKMRDEDQEVRQGNNLDWDLIRKVDSKNRKRMKQIIKTYGYIDPKIYGEKASKSAWLLIQHFPRSSVNSMENYLNMIKKNPEGFDIKDLALFEDRINVYKKKPQIYGSQAYAEANSDVYKFREIADIKNVDKRRKSIGLETLKEYAKGMEDDFGDKFELPEGYVEEK